MRPLSTPRKSCAKHFLFSCKLLIRDSKRRACKSRYFGVSFRTFLGIFFNPSSPCMIILDQLSRSTLFAYYVYNFILISTIVGDIRPVPIQSDNANRKLSIVVLPDNKQSTNICRCSVREVQTSLITTDNERRLQFAGKCAEVAKNSIQLIGMHVVDEPH